ncbi:MAG: hypothetical protein J0H98_06520 [Solirubrobacterales bacterium]|nr:hypothetical protein [Solirubrobacterales bacterium]
MDEKLAKRIRAQARIEAKKRKVGAIRRGVAVMATALTALFGGLLIARSADQQTQSSAGTSDLASSDGQSSSFEFDDENESESQGVVAVPQPTPMTTSQS